MGDLCDNMKELVLGDFKTYLNKHGIILKTTAPYLSSQFLPSDQVEQKLSV